ncbi:MAG: hypothetical protein WC342_07665 [Methanoregula sp.]|jgi:hypothetical protein
MMVAESHSQISDKREILVMLVAGSIAAFASVIPAAALPNINLTLEPFHATHDPSVPVPVYAYGDTLVVNATLVNSGPNPVTIMGFPPKAGIYYRLAFPFRTFDRERKAVIVGPGQSLSSQVIWDQKDAQEIPVEPGTYTIAVNYLTSKNTSGLWDESDLNGVSSYIDILILPRGGAYQGTIAVNETLTRENYTATLESVSFSNASWTADILFRYPDDEIYDCGATFPGEGPYIHYTTGFAANYSFDASTPRHFFDTRSDCSLRDSERLVFEGEPVPADARTISLNITSEGINLETGTHTTSFWNYSVDLTGRLAQAGETINHTSDRQSRPAPLLSAIPFIAAVSAFTVFAAMHHGRRP